MKITSQVSYGKSALWQRGTKVCENMDPSTVFEGLTPFSWDNNKKSATSGEPFKGQSMTTESLYLALVVLELPVAVEEARLLDLWYPLTLLEVAETPPVELTFCLPCLLVHLRHDVLDQVQLNSTKCDTAWTCASFWWWTQCPSYSRRELQELNSKFLGCSE